MKLLLLRNLVKDITGISAPGTCSQRAVVKRYHVAVSYVKVGPRRKMGFVTREEYDRVKEKAKEEAEAEVKAKPVPVPTTRRILPRKVDLSPLEAKLDAILDSLNRLCEAYGIGGTTQPPTEQG